jgi:hypothetical protein
LILGINEVSSGIKTSKYYKDFIPFVKYFQKLNYNTDYRFLKDIENKSEETLFIFFGHSLDVSDADYINEVFDYDKIYNITDNRIKSKIIVLIKDDNSKFKLLQNLISLRGKEDIESKMKDNVLRFLQILEIEQVLNIDLNGPLPPQVLAPSVH